MVPRSCQLSLFPIWFFSLFTKADNISSWIQLPISEIKFDSLSKSMVSNRPTTGEHSNSQRPFLSQCSNPHQPKVLVGGIDVGAYVTHLQPLFNQRVNAIKEEWRHSILIFHHRPEITIFKAEVDAEKASRPQF